MLRDSQNWYIVNTFRTMKASKYLFPILILLAACNPQRKEPTVDKGMSMYDSVYVTADIQWHQQYYPLLDRQVFSIDLLNEGLSFDSAHHIVGTGLNLYLSDILLPMTDTCLKEGCYQMDTTAAPYTFLPYKYFEGNITGCYLLDIEENQIQRIIGFTAGQMQIEYISEEDIRLDLLLYTADSTRYHATYQGPTLYQ